MRAGARWLLVLFAVGGMLFVLGHGPSSSIVARATQPDVYQVTAASAAIDTDGYQTGSPVDPAPAVNTAIPLTSIAADNQPSTNVHAAYVEPPTTAQAATQLNNVPVPYATQANALCSNCQSPVDVTADGNFAQGVDGERISTGAGRAHAVANPLAATADASNGTTTIGSPDQLTTLYDAVIGDFYTQFNTPHPPPSPLPNNPPPSQLAAPPPCQSAPAAPSPLGTVAGTPPPVCPGSVQPQSIVAQTGASESHTKVTTDSTGTSVDTFADLHNTQLLDGLVNVASIRTEVSGVGDGTAGGTKATATNTIGEVCVAGQCGLQITADGVCKQAAQICTNDPINNGLRSFGFNICRLNSSTGISGTTATGDAQGILLEWHLLVNPKDGSTAPDQHYYDHYKGACDSGFSIPHTNNGTSFYLKIGRSEAQLSTKTFPSLASSGSPGGTSGTNASTPVTVSAPGSNSSTNTNTTTTIVSPVAASGGAGGGASIKTVRTPYAVPAGVPVLVGDKDRKALSLVVFGLLELVLLSNLTAMALSRRASS